MSKKTMFLLLIFLTALWVNRRLVMPKRRAIQ